MAYEQRFLAQSPENYAQAALGAATSDITTMAATITCPVLMVPGANDLLFGQPHADELAEIIPHAVTVPFSGGAHFIPYQQPVEFAAVVRAFLQDKRLGRGA
ncbi:MAG: hypothetical protein J0G37_03505 [Afipia sp.]|nr:hypothetical protein [Afipia sp.]